MSRILCIGSLMIDITVVSDKETLFENSQKLVLPKGTKLQAEKILTHIGGSAINVATTFKALKHQPIILSQVGQDLNGTTISSFIAKSYKGSILYKDKNPTAQSVILIGRQDRTIFSTSANLEYDNWQFTDKEFDWIVLGPIHSHASKLYQQIKDYIITKKVRLCVIPSHFQITENKLELKSLLRLTDVLVLNLEEAKELVHLFSGQSSPKQIAATIEQYGPMVCAITQGAKGAIIKSGEIYFEREAYKTPVVDTTGAGDAFASGLVSLLAHQDIFSPEILEKGLEAGLYNSGQVIGEYGATQGTMTWKDFRKFY